MFSSQFVWGTYFLPCIFPKGASPQPANDSQELDQPGNPGSSLADSVTTYTFGPKDRWGPIGLLSSVSTDAWFDI